MNAGFEAKKSPWRFAVAPMMDGTNFSENKRRIRWLNGAQSFML
jgi:hypothetical protein